MLHVLTIILKISTLFNIYLLILYTSTLYIYLFYIPDVMLHVLTRALNEILTFITKYCSIGFVTSINL